MSITRNGEYIIYFIIVYVLQQSTSVGLISVPGIVIYDEIGSFGFLGCPPVIDSVYQYLSLSKRGGESYVPMMT